MGGTSGSSRSPSAAGGVSENPADGGRGEAAGDGKLPNTAGRLALRWGSEAEESEPDRDGSCAEAAGSCAEVAGSCAENRGRLADGDGKPAAGEGKSPGGGSDAFGRRLPRAGRSAEGDGRSSSISGCDRLGPRAERTGNSAEGGSVTIDGKSRSSGVCSRERRAGGAPRGAGGSGPRWSPAGAGRSSSGSTAALTSFPAVGRGRRCGTGGGALGGTGAFAVGSELPGGPPASGTVRSTSARIGRSSRSLSRATAGGAPATLGRSADELPVPAVGADAAGATPSIVTPGRRCKLGEPPRARRPSWAGWSRRRARPRARRRPERLRADPP